MSRYRAEVLADSPRGWWPLDDWKSGGQPTRALDHSGNNIHSIDWANIARCAGPVGGDPAGYFNGVSSGMTIPGTALLDLQEWTIEAWIKPEKVSDGGNTATQQGFIFEKTTNGNVNTQYSMFLEGNYTVARFYFAAGGGYTLNSAAHNLEPGTRWRHITVQRRASDGFVLHSREGVGWWNSDAQGAGPGTVVTNPAGTSFIGCYGGGAYRFKGAIAHVAVYPTFLSQARLQAHVKAAGLDAVGY